jgi:hypothetical protein
MRDRAQVIRARLALYSQVALAFLSVRGFCNYTETFRHPIGLPERAYRNAFWASLFLMAWLWVEAIVMAWPRVGTKVGMGRGWKPIAVLILSLLLFLITEAAVDGILIRE